MSSDREALMPTTAARARKWIKSGKATPFFRGQMFCVRLNVKSGATVQPIAVGIDPGSKWEGYTVKSEAHTYLNIQADAVTWVKEAVKIRKAARVNRRKRKTPYRALNSNRRRGGLAYSIVARISWKLRIASWLCKLFPVDCFVVEDVKARSKGQPKWDKMFSPLEHGKTRFYEELEKLAWVETLQGYETFLMREKLGLRKGGNKHKQNFYSHCVDSWVLANWYTGGHIVPDNEVFLILVPLRFHRRQLHAMQPTKKGVRKKYGGTRSIGLKRGSIVSHYKYGKVYVGGTMKGRVSLHSIETGRRLCQNSKSEDCRFLTFNTWRRASSSAF
jgi:hypothetical protein